MTAAVLYKLLGLCATVAAGWLAGRLGWIGGSSGGGSGSGSDDDAARILGNAAFHIFVPALLFRTTSRIDLAHLPWHTLAAFFVPVIGLLLIVYALQRWQLRRQRSRGGDILAPPAPAGPATRAITAAFGNTVQLGIPLSAALYGEAGLAIHIAIVSLHALLLLTLPTALAEVDLARAHARSTRDVPGTAPYLRTLTTTVRNTLVHPVVLPVLAGLAWNLGGLGLHPVADGALLALSAAVSPVCLVLIGLTLARHGIRGSARRAGALAAVKLLLLPGLVLLVAHTGFGLTGMPLGVVVMAAALPAGSNALMFAQRYRVLEAEVTATIVLSTLGFVATASLWLAVLGRLGSG